MEPWLLELIFFLPLIALFGIITSYTDIRFGKIKNKHLTLFALISLAFYAFLIIYYIISDISIKITYFRDFIVNFLIAICFGVVFWVSKIWSAADAKLFAVYSLLLPLSFYSNNYFSFFPSLAILINTFVPIFMVFLLVFVPYVLIEKRKQLAKTFKRKEILNFLITIFWISGLPRLLYLVLGFRINIVGMMIIIISLSALLNATFGEKIFAVSIILAILRLIVDLNYITNYQNLIVILIIFLVASIFFVSIKLCDTFLVKKIKISELKEGMILAETIYRGGDKYILGKDSKVKMTIDKTKILEIDKIGEGLKSNEIALIKRLAKNKKLLFKEIRVHQTFPFAPFMFFGVIITVLIKGSFFVF